MQKYDIAIVGAGFAGSLMAIILRRQGKSVLLIEKGKHPRFAIGESSTPLANLIFSDLCDEWHLESLKPLTKFGSWQEKYPHIPCGLKRGFSFFDHQNGQRFSATKDHQNELFVAASKSDQIGDTHWYREDVDHFIVKEALSAGVHYHDQTEITTWKRQNDIWELNLVGKNQTWEAKAGFLIDASGSAGAIAKYLVRWKQKSLFKNNTRAIYAHFKGVKPWHKNLTDDPNYPFSADDSVIHHLIDEGWMWQLRFNNDITSSGFVTEGEKTFKFDELLDKYPEIKVQFEDAIPVTQLYQSGQLQRGFNKAAGEGFALLPHTFGFIDPILSSGIAFSLLGIERLARILSKPTETYTENLKLYSQQLSNELEFTDFLVAGLYYAKPRFEAFTNYSFYYFAGAIASEHRRMLGKAQPDDGFLFYHNQKFRKAVIANTRKLMSKPISGLDLPAFVKQIKIDIEPWNIAGLCDKSRRNLYPYI